MSASSSGNHAKSSTPIFTKIRNCIAKSLNTPRTAAKHSRRDGVVQEAGAPSISFFSRSSNVNITNSNFNRIHGDATIIRFGNGQFTEIERNLIGDYIANHIVLPAVDANSKEHDLIQMELLPRAEAVFDDYKVKKKICACFEGTRVALLREMADWVTGPDGPRMYILSGLAGIGKSTVAYTVASRSADLNLLAASFFFSRDDADLNNAKKFFTTIAYQLCVYDESFSKAIGATLGTECGYAATRKDPQEQLQVLILEPLKSIVKSRVRPLLVVVDAIDECEENDVYAVVEGLRQLVRDLPSFKVILTKRPQLSLDYFLERQRGNTLFYLQAIEDKIVDDDIRLYLKHHLSHESVRYRFPKQQWCASDEEIGSLVRAAGGLFIIASTAVRYILDKVASDPSAQMQKLLNACAQGHTPFKDLGLFYTVVLRNVVPEDYDEDDEDDGYIINRYRSVVGAIILIQRPLPVSTISRLISVDSVDVHAVLDNLQSVILLGDDDIPLIYHRSFSDYLIDQLSCKDTRLRIDPKIGHTQIAKHCFAITNNHLKYNILDLGIPARYMDNKDALEKDGITGLQLQEKIPLHLQYASLYWGDHFKAANTEDSDLQKGLKKFVDEHTLHWFEMLSLIGHLDTAHRAIAIALKLLPTPPDLLQLLSDALRFISKFYEIINRSALHTYYSALPFSPTNNLLHSQYIDDDAYKLFRIEEAPTQWDIHVAFLNHGKYLDVVKFSLDSTLLATYPEKYVKDNKQEKLMIPQIVDLGEAGVHTSTVHATWLERNDGQEKLKIWDAISGTPISTIPGHRFAIANDFSIIASSENKSTTCQCYNIDGTPTDLTLTTSSNIQRLALSSETNRIATALSDGTVWLWDCTSRRVIDKFHGFQHPSRLQFSSTGTRLAYSTAKDTIIIQLRDGITGRFVANLCCGSILHEFEFSGDGTRAASVSDDCLKVWNSDGMHIDTVMLGGGLHPKKSLGISVNGSLLATGYGPCVTLWAVNSQSLVKTVVLDPIDRVKSMAFSQDNVLAIVTMDRGIFLYDVKTKSAPSELPLLEARFVSIVGLAFSSDCNRFACATSTNVHLCDIRGNKISYPPKQRATAIALSRDCAQLACGFEDGTAELRGTGPTRGQIVFDKVHKEDVSTVAFEPDGRLFASGSGDGIIKLWNCGDGSLHGTLNVPENLYVIALSKRMLVTGGLGIITLWDHDVLTCVHTLKMPGELSWRVSISDESDLFAFDHAPQIPGPDILTRYVDIFELGKSPNKFIIGFKTSSLIYQLAFLRDKSCIVAQLYGGRFLFIDLINKHMTRGLPMLEHLVQHPNTSIWHGVPVWLDLLGPKEQVSALFSQHQDPVPVLRIPHHIPVDMRRSTHGSSLIALACTNGRIILIRPPTSSGYAN